ncbi:MAG: creatininase family protein [Nitrospirota bacterium]|nr:MAG: creatininase family protein [Nitrospirota bacterium]
MIIENITMSEFKKHLHRTKTIVFPFGTVEEHGSHLPLNTDTLIIYEALKMVKKKVFLAPPVHYGVCTTTKHHPGTINITPGTLRSLSRDMVVDSYKKGLRNFLLISGHGGSQHMAALKEISEELIEELKGIRIAAFSPYDLLWKELSELADTENDSHAGEIETSMILYLAKDLVKGRAKEEYPKIPKPFVQKDYTKYWKGGVWGDPQKASFKKGEKAIKTIVDKISDIIKEIDKK